MFPKPHQLDIPIHSEQHSTARSCSGSRLSITTKISGYLPYYEQGHKVQAESTEIEIFTATRNDEDYTTASAQLCLKPKICHSRAVAFIP